MRPATALTIIAIGAILAFAVSSSPSWFNINIAGWVIMLTGVAGLFLTGRSLNWLRQWRLAPPRPKVDRRDSPPPRAIGSGPDTPDRTIQAKAEPAEKTTRYEEVEETTRYHQD
jgi:hypothetical protein